MRHRKLGKTGLEVSEIGFGSGATGGLMIKGQPKERVRVAARAIELGVNYFDTAAIYGNGQSEIGLGRVLKELKPNIVLGTKVRLYERDLHDIGGAVMASVEGSLVRLEREAVDLIQLHNSLTPEGSRHGDWLTPSQTYEAMEALQRVVDQGKARHWGINGMGDPATVKKVTVESGAATIQSLLNLLNPSAAWPVPAGFPYTDYDALIPAAKAANVGVLAIRVLAGGALTGSTAGHPLATTDVDVINTSGLVQDASNVRRFQFLIDEGIVDSYVEAAIRFDLTCPGVSTALVGVSEMSHIEQAVAAANKGPLPEDVFERFEPIWATLEP